MNFSTRLRLLKWRCQDNLRHSRLLRTGNAIRLFVAAMFRNSRSSADLLSRALAFSESSHIDRLISSKLKAHRRIRLNSEIWSEVVLNLPRYHDLVFDQTQLTRSIVLKAPGANGEKGVLLMYFEYNWVRLINGLSEEEFEWLDEHFDLVLSTSWSPTDYASLSWILAKSNSPVFVQPCNFGEKSKLQNFDSRIVVLDSLPCDWINPDFYPVDNKARPIDIVMVANWGEFKRHWEFFTVLRKLSPDLRVVLIGQKEGERDSDYIKELAKSIGVPQKLEIHNSLPIEEVSKIQSQSKVSLIFTRREGCCVAAVESLFAGCALGMRSDAHVGPLSYINPQTGMRLRPRHLAEDLSRLLEISANLDPATWARENKSCCNTLARLNRKITESVRERGLPWTCDLVIPQWRPYPSYKCIKDAEAMRPVCEDLHEKFPNVFPEWHELLPN